MVVGRLITPPVVVPFSCAEILVSIFQEHPELMATQGDLSKTSPTANPSFSCPAIFSLNRRAKFKTLF